mmetsp:Transcript_39429/g.61463  ORF Transcript_39429/g.61463 Transcript_39429/m.61463 type:complete len:104 (+) Transcript_39429:1736-2047(+)
MKKFKIVNIHASSYWLWFNCNDRCAICRNDLREPSISFQPSYKLNQNPVYSIEDCKTIGIGFCRHSFHLDCIERWLDKLQRCPICVRTWNYHKVVILDLETKE